MQDLVGQEIPTEQEVADAIRDLERIERRFGRYLVLLDDDQRRAALKPRTGWEPVAGTVAALARRFGVSLPGITPDGLEADRRLAERLAPLAAKVSAFQQRLDDTVLEARGECWYAATAFYTALSRVGDSSAELSGALKPVAEFFARRAKKPAPDAGGERKPA